MGAYNESAAAQAVFSLSVSCPSSLTAPKAFSWVLFICRRSLTKLFLGVNFLVCHQILLSLRGSDDGDVKCVILAPQVWETARPFPVSFLSVAQIIPTALSSAPLNLDCPLLKRLFGSLFHLSLC